MKKNQPLPNSKVEKAISVIKQIAVHQFWEEYSASKAESAKLALQVLIDEMSHEEREAIYDQSFFVQATHKFVLVAELSSFVWFTGPLITVKFEMKEGKL